VRKGLLQPILLAIVLLPLCAWAQFGGFTAGGSNTAAGVTINGSGFPPTGNIELGNLKISTQGHPSLSPSAGELTSFRGRSVPGRTYFSRTAVDKKAHIFYGYELLLVEQRPGVFLATLTNGGITAMEAAAAGGLHAEDWSRLELKLPAPKEVNEGAVIQIDLPPDPATGALLTEQFTIQPYTNTPALGTFRATSMTSAPDQRQVPTVEGAARDFTAADAELRIQQPRVLLNGTKQSNDRGAPGGATGNLVWFYLPGHGRYILSLAPRLELGFQKAGEVRGGAIEFKLGDDMIRLECFTPIATGNSAYTLYVLDDAAWEPTASSQKGQFALGSVDPEELELLKKN
jgi:hypothetical protein